jgi:hypothetical protein
MHATSLAVRKSDKVARSNLAHAEGVADDAYSVTRLVIPKAHAAPYLAVTKALSAAKGEFNRTTMPIGQDAAGSANGDCAVTTEQLLASPSWIGNMSQHKQALDAAREAFAVALPAMMAAVQGDSRYSAKFDASEWPTAEQIRDSFTFTIDGPDPIGSFSYLPLSGAMADALEKRYEKKLARQVGYGQMRTAKEMADFVKNMANSLAENAKFLRGESDRARKPKVYDTLTTNLESIVGKVRNFAVKDTDEGAALLTLADKVQSLLVPAGRTASDFKDNEPLSRDVAEKAAAIMDDIEEIGFDF